MLGLFATEVQAIPDLREVAPALPPDIQLRLFGLGAPESAHDQGRATLPLRRPGGVYERQYGGRISLIASQLAGRPIRRRFHFSA